MIEEIEIKKTVAEAITNNDLALLNKLLNDLFHANQHPPVVTLMRIIRNYEYPTTAMQENIIRGVIHATKNWNRGWFFTQCNIISLLLPGSNETFTQCLNQILITEINNQALDVSKLVNENINYLTLGISQKLTLCILANCSEKEFHQICAYIARFKWNDQLARALQQHQVDFKFSLPKEIVDLAEERMAKKLTVTSNPAITNNSAIAQKKITQAEQLLTMRYSNVGNTGCSYILELEKYIDETFRTRIN